MMKKFLCAIVVFGLSPVGWSALPDEIQVYDGEISGVNELTLDVHTNYSAKGISSPAFVNERVSHHGLRLTPEFNFGLTKTLEIGLYVPTIYTPAYGYELAGYKPRLKWLPYQQRLGNPVSVGINVEYASLKRGMEESTREMEYRFILARESNDWSFAVNPILVTHMSSGAPKTPEFNFYFQGLKRLSGAVSEMGIEYYQFLGPYNNVLPGAQQAKTLFLVMNVNAQSAWVNGWNFHLGVGRGWNSADPWLIKMIISPR